MMSHSGLAVCVALIAAGWPAPAEAAPPVPVFRAIAEHRVSVAAHMCDSATVSVVLRSRGDSVSVVVPAGTLFASRGRAVWAAGRDVAIVASRGATVTFSVPVLPVQLAGFRPGRSLPLETTAPTPAMGNLLRRASAAKPGRAVIPAAPPVVLSGDGHRQGARTSPGIPRVSAPAVELALRLADRKSRKPLPVGRKVLRMLLPATQQPFTTVWPPPRRIQSTLPVTAFNSGRRGNGRRSHCVCRRH